ncbi:MAG: NADH-quinone oxidoreductase subunit M [Candidatus Neomarinimicrobiota bacterium]
MTEHLLSVNLLIALAGLIFITLTNREKTGIIKTAAAIVSGVQCWIAGEILFNFNPLETALQFSERIKWIAALRIDYYLGVDSINLVFLITTALLVFLSVFISWKNEKRVKEYFVLLLTLDIGLIGIFSAINLFLFLVLLGIAFFAVYLMIGLWSEGNNASLTNRVGIFFLLAYILILLGIILLFYENRLHSLNLTELVSGVTLSVSAQYIIFAILFFGFALLIPLFPFHGWLIPIIKNTPVGVSMLIIGVMTKIGCFGLIRIIAPVLPVATNTLALGIGIWGLLNVLYGAVCALGSTDSDRILGYLSLQQLGIFLIGLATITNSTASNIPIALTGMSGALLMAISHACLICLLLIVFKKVIPSGSNAFKSSSGTRTIVILALLAGLGMPGFSDFFARFMTMLGAFQTQGMAPIVILSLIGMLLNFVVFLRLFSRMIFNQPNVSDHVKFETNEIFVVVILLIVIILLGLFPGFLLNILKSGIIRMLEMFSTAVIL